MCSSISKVMFCGRFPLSTFRCVSFPFLIRRAVMSDTTQPGSTSAAFVTCPDVDTAKKLARGLLEKKLVACVNVIPGLTSIYEWEGKVEEDSEVLMMIKTRTSKVDDVAQFIRENHPYDVPECISTKIDKGNEQYLKWIGEIVPEK